VLKKIKQRVQTKTRILFLWLIILIGAVNSSAQVNAFEGTRFFFTFTKSTSLFSPQPDNTLTLLSRTNTTATISNPAKGYTNIVSLVANTPKDISIPKTISTTDSTDVIRGYGVEINANDKITVQLADVGGAGDGTMVYPYDKLGTDYYAMSFFGSASGFYQGRSFVAVVATENNTLIEVTPAAQTTSNNSAGVPYYVTLDKGQTHKLEGLSLNDLTGTHIKVLNGCKPVAVFGGATCAAVPSTCTLCGHLFEIMPQVDTWGKKFLIAPLEGSSFFTPKYTYSILANTNNTKITVNGSSSTINKGDIVTVNSLSSTSSVCIDASYPVLVAQYTEGYNCQGGSVPRMHIISPAEQLVKSAVVVGNSTSLTGTAHKVLIIAKTISRGLIKFDGSYIPITSFSTFSDCQEWSYASVTSSRAPHSIYSDSGFLAYTYNAEFTAPYLVTAAANARILAYDIGIKNLGCGSLNPTFYNSGDSIKILSSKWLFDDNTSQVGKQVSKTYTSQGFYSVTNIVTYQNDCPFTDTIRSSLRTIAYPVAGLSINDTSQCFRGNEFVFSDTSRYFNGAKKKTTTWSYSDTPTVYKNFASLTRVMANPGTYTITLKVESQDLCTDSVVKTFKVNANPKTDYQITSPQCFKSHLFKPTQKTTVVGGAVGGYDWDFGDGTKSIQPIPVKTYSKDTAYSVTLITRSTANCYDTLVRQFLINPSPQASFTANNACLNDTVKTTNLSSFSGPLNYLWSFGDLQTATDSNANKTYVDTGTYNLMLTATNSYNCADSMMKKVTILPAPKPSFTYIKKCTQNPTSYTNTSFTYGVPGATYKWDVGNSAQSNTLNYTHKYTKEGLFQVKLVATLPNGCKDSVTNPVYINPIPNVAFTINDSMQCIRGNNFDFFNATTLSEGKINEFVWKLNDTLWNTNVSNNKVFDTYGIYTIKLVATTDSACADSITKIFEVAPQTQMSLISTQDTQCYKNHAFVLTNNSTVPTGTVSYTWNYSNSDVDTIAQPAPKTFSSSGKYQLTLLALTDKGCRDSVVRNFTLYPSPELNFEVNDVCGSDSARFSNFSKVTTGRVVNWHWDLGDGDTSDAKNPIHYYNNFGIYNVSVIGITDLGCPDTLFVDTALFVKPAPKSFFNTKLDEQRGNETSYQFFDQSTDADDYYWNFDRGETSRQANPNFTFKDTGKYHIILTVSNTEGCFSSHDTTIFVVPDIELYIPNAFSPNKDVINPVFRIEGSYFYREFEMQIFDRWGQRVFYSNDPEIGWDGTYDGRRMPEGIYIYSVRIIGTDTKVRNYKGNLHLLY
jgi:gliding motility-associated-like protein